MPKKKSGVPSNKWSLGELKEFIRGATKKAEQIMRSLDELITKPAQAWRTRKGFGKLREKSGKKSRGEYDIPLGLDKKKKDLVEQAKELYKFNNRTTTKRVEEAKVEETRLQEEARLRREEEKRSWSEETSGFTDTGDRTSDIDYIPDDYDPDNYKKDKWDLFNDWDEKTRRAYESFKNHYDPTLTPDEYDKLMWTFGEVKDYLQSFGYGDKQANADSFVNNIIDYQKEGIPSIKIYETMKDLSQKLEGKTQQEALSILDEYLHNQ